MGHTVVVHGLVGWVLECIALAPAPLPDMTLPDKTTKSDLVPEYKCPAVSLMVPTPSLRKEGHLESRFQNG